MAHRPGEDETVEVSSPACSMHEASDAYMGYADREELVAVLSELLEAERRGAIEPGESPWCAMLVHHLTQLGGVPSQAVGGRDKAMANADLDERVALLDRGQGRVARRLREILARVRDDRLHRDLAEMLRAREADTARADPKKARVPPGT